jgi:hypothetical protein
VRAFDSELLSPVLRHDGNAGAGLFDAQNLPLFGDLDSFGAQLLAHHAHRIRIILWQHAAEIEQRHIGPETAIGLSHLATDRTRANHHQMIGKNPILENGFIGEKGNIGDSGNGWDGGAAPGCDHKTPRSHLFPVSRDSLAIEKASARLHHRAAEFREALDRVMGRDGINDAMDIVVHFGEIDSCFACFDAETIRVPHHLGPLGGGKQRLRWNATRVEAIAAHLAGFDQHGSRAQLGGHGRNRQSGRSGADDADIRGKRVAHDRLTCESCKKRRPKRRSGRSDGD